ncbi:hypothetical protein RN001_010477 [Aquatica leii]|uniref:Uncharacterized protein n=1 Tax=Aquatica leii TaxID=1421715 RepID=A0AAN7PA01_9COLE|nr:hypothetical protein RN001_010477 [Aquatica leii]
MLPNLSKEQYNLNKIHYFSYHGQVTNAFQKDCEKLLLAFERINDLSFKAYSEAWKKLHFGLVFSGQNVVEERKFFIEACFFVIKKYVVFSQNTAVQVGALYTLYALYYKQPIKVKIRCTYDEYTHLTKLVTKMQQRDVNDVAFIFTKLMSEDAFQFVALPNVCALEGKFMWQERKMVNNIFEAVKKGDPIVDTKSVLFSKDFYSLNCLNDVSEDYAKGLEKYGFPKQDCARILDLPEEIQILCKNMDRTSESSLSVKVPIRTSLKKKAFASRVNAPR